MLPSQPPLTRPYLFLLGVLLSFCSGVSPQSRILPTGGPANACLLQSQCCNMASSNCCIKGGGCYTTWERVCDPSSPSEPQCTTTGRRFCIPVTTKACRTVTERIVRRYPISHCIQGPLRQCFNYKHQVCVPKEVSSLQTISWNNEELVLNNASTIRRCFQVQSLSCNPREESQTVRVPVQRTKSVPRVSQSCSLQTVRGEDNVIQVPVTEVVNRRLCWAIPETKCLKNKIPCGQTCPQGSPCGSLQPIPQTVCPLNPSGSAVGGSNCINIRPPVCSMATCANTGLIPGGGVISPGIPEIPRPEVPLFPNTQSSQECCRQTTKNICRQVPTRVTKLVKKVVPGKVGYKRVCKDLVTQVPQTYWDQELKVVNKTVKNCRPVTKEECINLTVRQYDVETKNVTDTINVVLPTCDHKEVNAEYCHTFPTGTINCRNTTMPKTFNLHKIKCDISQVSQQCAVVPTLSCTESNSPPSSCRLVPKTVCPKKENCLSGGACNGCDSFRRNAGFGTCPGNNCPNWAAPDNWPSSRNANSFLKALNSSPREVLNANLPTQNYP